MEERTPEEIAQEEESAQLRYKGLHAFQAEAGQSRRSAMRRTAAQMDEIRKRQQKIERIVFTGSVIFVISIFSAVIVTNESTRRGAVNMIRSISSSSEVDERCKLPQFKNTIQCQDAERRRRADWNSVVHYEEGKAPPFALREE